MSDGEVSVHPTASVHSRAQLEPGVKIGPFAVIGEDVIIHEDTAIDAHVCITGKTEIGKRCRFSPFSSIGGEPQDVSYKGEETIIKIGNNKIAYQASNRKNNGFHTKIYFSTLNLDSQSIIFEGEYKAITMVGYMQNKKELLFIQNYKKIVSINIEDPMQRNILFDLEK